MKSPQLNVKGIVKKTTLRASKDQTELRTMFEKIKLVDFLIGDQDYDFSSALKSVNNHDLLQSIAKRLDNLQFVFTYVRCAMRYEEHFVHKEGTLKAILEDNFDKMTLLCYFCLHNDFNFIFIQMDLLCNFRRINAEDINKIINRIVKFHDTIHFMTYENYKKRFLLQAIYVFTDTEGIPTQELCAIAVDICDLTIIDIYHKFAYASGDTWSRRNIHGINTDVTYHFAFRNERKLQNDFENWKSNYNIIKVFENSPNEMTHHFFDNVIDLKLPPWEDRVNQRYHLMANRLKDGNAVIDATICPTKCSSHIHSLYKPYKTLRRCKNLSERLKLQHGFHCSLYDAFELYLFYKFEHCSL